MFAWGLLAQRHAGAIPLPVLYGCRLPSGGATMNSGSQDSSVAVVAGVVLLLMGCATIKTNTSTATHSIGTFDDIEPLNRPAHKVSVAIRGDQVLVAVFVLAVAIFLSFSLSWL